MLTLGALLAGLLYAAGIGAVKEWEEGRDAFRSVPDPIDRKIAQWAFAALFPLAFVVASVWWAVRRIGPHLGWLLLTPYRLGRRGALRFRRWRVDRRFAAPARVVCRRVHRLPGGKDGGTPC